jgi:hypothetical protein
MKMFIIKFLGILHRVGNIQHDTVLYYSCLVCLILWANWHGIKGLASLWGPFLAKAIMHWGNYSTCKYYCNLFHPLSTAGWVPREAKYELAFSIKGFYLAVPLGGTPVEGMGGKQDLA